MAVRGNRCAVSPGSPGSRAEALQDSQPRIFDAGLCGDGNAKENGMATKAPNPVDRHVGSRVRMRRMMMGMSQEKLGDAIGLTFQQVQKYEKGTNRIGASRLQQISQTLQVPVAFFFEGSPTAPGSAVGTEAPSPSYVSDFLASSDGLALTKAFMQIKDTKLRRRIVELVEGIAGQTER
jgi:transcriptional regulator with XRE-family HTH domain